MGENWVIENLQRSLDIWNDKLQEIWTLLTQSPTEFKGGAIWSTISNIHGALQAIGLALLVLFFVSGVIKTCGSFSEVKRPEQVLKLFVRFALAKGVITYGMDLMMAIFNIVQGVINTVMNTSGFRSSSSMILPSSIVRAVNELNFLESIPQSVGKSFIKSFCAVCLEGAIIILACIIYSSFASSPPVVDSSAGAVTQVWAYLGEMIFNMLVLVGTIRMSDSVVKDMFGV